MGTDAKIILSGKELELVCNTEWILTKQSVIRKVYDLFGSLASDFNELLQLRESRLPVDVFINSPKISKGENYRLLPYVILDYPRFFSREDTFAIRVFFWWGHFFSISLQLSGRFKQRAAAALKGNFLSLQHKGYSICIHETPWEHHFGEDNFKPAGTMDAATFADILSGKSFVKIAKNTSLVNWDQVPAFMSEAFTELLAMVESD